jgi:hypothetical protein
MTKVAADYGVTSTALKKTCKRHKIPTPERGYWAKLEHGKRVRHDPLPEIGDSRLVQVRIVGSSAKSLPDGVQRARAKALERLAETTSATPDASDETSIGAEPRVEPSVLVPARRAISKARPDAQGFVSAKGPASCVCDCTVIH